MNLSKSKNKMNEIFGEYVSAYSRSQAIEDGELVDVTSIAKEVGFKCPVAITRTLFERYVEPDEPALSMGESMRGRLWDTLWMLRLAAIRDREAFSLFYNLYYTLEGKKKLVTLKAVIGPGDYGEPVITIMLPDED